MQIDVSVALSIEGWMQEPELVWLAQQASIHTCIVEIGSYKGRSTRALADNTTGNVIAVDTWTGPLSTLARDPLESFESEFRTNLEPHVSSGKVIPCTPDSIPAYIVIGRSDDGCLSIIWEPDMIFIDGDHIYSSVKKDIELWLPKLQNGGLICGHDCGYEEVSRAVNEVFPDVKCAPNTTIWYATK